MVLALTVASLMCEGLTAPSQTQSAMKTSPDLPWDGPILDAGKEVVAENRGIKRMEA